MLCVVLCHDRTNQFNDEENLIMAQLAVREMVLYKHGVGFFVREGDVSGESTALTFRQEEINDVLKSLAVFDRGGGQILGIHYQTPMDKAARLASSSIRLSD